MKQIKKILIIASIAFLCGLAVRAAEARLERQYSLTEAYEGLGQYYQAACRAGGYGHQAGIVLN